MTSNEVFDPTTDQWYKVNQISELRIPAKFITNSFRAKRVKECEALIYLKLLGSRVNYNKFARSIGISSKTAKRTIARLEKLQWVGSDKKFVFPRSWSRLGYQKSRGLFKGFYLCTIPEGRIKYFLFTWALKFTRRLAVRALKLRSALPKDLPVLYYRKSLNLSERTYFRFLKGAYEAKLIKSKQQYRIEGPAHELATLRERLHETQLFVNLFVKKIKGEFLTVAPEPSELTFLI